MQPGERATAVRAVQRVAGTFVGVAVIVAVTALTGEVWVLVACTGIAAFGLFALDERGYFWLVVMLTPTALLMISACDFQSVDIGVQRTLNSALGISWGWRSARRLGGWGRGRRVRAPATVHTDP